MTYCECGQLLLLAVYDTTVRLPSGKVIAFRRRTDFVTCDRCLKCFQIDDLRRRTEAKTPPD